MSTTDQMQQMLELLQQQMKTMADLQAENARLREQSANTTASTTGNAGKPKKPDRPTVNNNIDDREWALFIDAWSRYKQMCNLMQADVGTVRLELRACCSTEVNKLLFEYVGATVLDTVTEAQLLGHMKEVTVKTVHKEVHRMAFHALSQDQGESVTQFVARLKSKAFLCQFEINCSCCTPPVKQSYAEDEIAQRLVTGLCNQEHQRKIMSEAASLTTLDLKIKRLQVLEATEESSLTIHKPAPPSEAALIRSQYKARKTEKVKSDAQEGNSQQGCRWCGRTSHPGGKLHDRRSCPAQKKICDNCGRKGHLSKVCEKPAAAASATDDGGRAEEVQDEETHLPALTSDASVSFAFGTDSTHNLNTASRHRDFQMAYKTKEGS